MYGCSKRDAVVRQGAQFRIQSYRGFHGFILSASAYSSGLAGLMVASPRAPKTARTVVGGPCFAAPKHGTIAPRHRL